MFMHGLADRIQNEIYALELPSALDDLVDLATRVDARLQRCDLCCTQGPTPETADWLVPASNVAVSHKLIMNPCRWIELGSLGRRKICIRRTLLVLLGFWSYHYSLPSKSQHLSVEMRLPTGGIFFEKSFLSATLLLARLQWGSSYHSCQALLDSGVEGNFIDSALAHQLKNSIVPLTHPICVSALSSQILPSMTLLMPWWFLIIPGLCSTTLTLSGLRILC